MTDTKTPALRLGTISHGGSAGKWRTEAMRSHDSARLILITRGQGRITIAGLTGGFGPNNLIYLPPRTLYGIEPGPTVFGQILTLPAPAGWRDAPFHLRLVDVARQTELTGHFDAIERELQPGGNARAAACHLGLLEIFVERQLQLNASTPANSRKATPAARLVQRYSDLIAADFPDLRGVRDYAADLGVTTTHLTRCCRQTCGKSALSFITEPLHYAACTMLRETALPVQDVAKRLGFSTPAYFTRTFQAKSGLSPSAFRKTGQPSAAR